MLDVARRRVMLAAATKRIRLVEARAEELPFDDESFDALTFTYLLRYVDDPGATLAELARVVRPGGTIASLEFGLPEAAVPRALWELYTGVGLPLAGLARGRRLPARQHPGLLRPAPARPAARALARGGCRRHHGQAAESRGRHRRVGTARMTAEARPAFYALRSGGWRDYITLLHPPYTLWHLSYVAIGAGLAPEFRWSRFGLAIAAFFLAVGVGAHALDELMGRPLQTRIPRPVLAALGAL